mgnify:CR=1 FL=1|jgi:transposase-like protein
MGRNYKRYTAEEKMELITRCRQSGLSDYEWCRENNINSSTFYYWIKKLRIEACELELSTTVAKVPQKQEVVKIDIVPEQETIPYVSENVTNESKTTASIELMLNGCTLKIHNNVNPTLLAQTINIIRGSIC